MEHNALYSPQTLLFSESAFASFELHPAETHTKEDDLVRKGDSERRLSICPLIQTFQTSKPNHNPVSDLNVRPVTAYCMSYSNVA